MIFIIIFVKRKGGYVDTYKSNILIYFWRVAFPRIPGIGQTKGFTVVIDAGHGGKTGRHWFVIARKRHHAFRSKKTGRIDRKNHKDVKVIYTRKDDSFVALDRRAAIANNAKANLFISIHCNAVPKNRNSPQGVETLFWDSIGVKTTWKWPRKLRNFTRRGLFAKV